MAIFYLLLFLCTYLVSAARGPVLWNQPKNNQRSSWNDQVNSPSNNWYRNDAPILAQSEIIMPDYIRKQSGFALYPVNQQEQATFGTKLKPQKIRPENYNSQSEKPFGADGKQQRRSDFPGNKVPPRKWNIGSPYPPVNYYNLKDKQKVHPNEVLKVKSLSPQNFRQVFKAEQTPISIKNALNGNSIHKPSVHREYALSAISSPKLNQFSPQNQGYIVSAPSRVSTTSPVDFTTNKSPIFFVTDGYRNVLHQGTNEPEAINQDTQNKQESKTVEIENAPNTVKIIDHGHTESDRDDTLHEPRDDHDNEKIQTDDRIQNDDDNESDEEEHDVTDSKKSQRESSEEESSKSDEEDEREDSREPDNEHADPKHVPTRPIYPGEGVWARQRIRHRPHITQHRFIQPQVEYQTKPDGYEVFSNLEQYFDKQKENIEQNFNRVPKNTPILAQAQIKQPNSVVPLVIYDPFQEFQQLQNRQPIPYIQQPYIQQPYIQRPSHRPVDNNVVQASRSQRYRAQPVQQQPSEEEAEEFVPERLYTQVRNSEDEKHLPQDPVEGPRLKEVIKDSKVHTLYSEEGYEDSAYDHAGHEKKAEQDEGKAKFEKEKVDSKKKKKFIEKPVDNHEGQSVKVIVTESPKPKSDDTSPSDNDYTKNNNKFGANKFNNYITGPEIKTAHIKDKDNGDVQLEIESQVQVIMQPNNSTKAHKYVRIYPKVPAEVSNKDDDQAESHVIEQINEMTLKQFNSNEKAAAADENAPKERRKRASEPWFEDVDIDTEFIDRINHTFEGPRKEVVDTQKFPYYKSKDVNKDSPLRYAENPNNVPVKKAGELSFYKAADKHACPEIIQNIDPVPDHIKNAKESDDYDEEDDEEDDANGESSQVDERVDGDEAVTPKGPRIELGDKIDCLKARYFGENPLDNPFFKEATVGPVEPLFKDLEKAVNSFKSPNKKSASEKKASEIKKDKKDETEKKPLKKSENIKGDFLDNPADHQAAASFIINAEIQPVPNVDNSINSPENDKPVSSALVSLITTPKYTINLVPNNIYDQIKLLEHLPEQAKTEEPREKDNATANEIEPESTTVEPKNENLSTEKIEEIIPTSTEQHSNGNRQSKSLDLDQETKSDDSSEDGETINEPQALRRLRKRPKRPMYQIFDINKFLTTTPFSLIDSDPTTVLPKYKVISEVFYKDEIKPNEQLNVFADVINNIKNSTHTDIIPIESPSRYPEFEILNGGSIEEYDTVPQIKKSSSVRVKKFQSDSSNYNNNVDEEEIAANHEPERNTYQESYVEKRHRQVTKNRKSNTDEEVTTKKTPKYRRRRPTTTTTTLRTTIATQESAPSNHKPYVIDYLEDTEQVIGLVPPESWQYKTIVLGDMEAQNSNDVTERVKMPREKTKPAKSQNPAPVTEPSDEVPPEVNINLFPVIGMKPPSKERARSYFEYLMNNMNTMNKMNSNNSKKIRRRVSSVPRRHLRRTRDASRPSYSEVSRSRGRQTADVEQTTIAPEDDDYVPHRPTNYHYDEKTGKIVYHSKPKEESSEEVEEEIEEIEVPVMPGIYLERAEGATHPTPKQTTVSPLLVTATPPPDGQGLLDFVVLLKNNPNYKYIPDPTTPKPGAVTTTEAFATVDPKSTNPPEFLNILSKVRNDNRYKLIEDPKEAKSKPKTTTPAPPEEEEEEELEEEEVKPIVTSKPIDYSKYKTIERPKHNLSSRYNAEEQTNLDEVVTVRRPLFEEVHRAEEPRTTKTYDTDEEVPTTQKIVQSRRRSRPRGHKHSSSKSVDDSESPTTLRSSSRRRSKPASTKRPTTLITEASEEIADIYTPTERMTAATNPKAKRVYRKRPIRIRPTTEHVIDDGEHLVRRSVDDDVSDDNLGI
ncbi:uncharacterized protein LOC143195049 isoform X2 [Rhynchophorus ferrugineus]|uniref:uncharacterized protein LOC143195049 isoform X2 n=1 Tax=Rhynchophorus ferrugineus TaxID=354439 RepID=UPI003FCCA52F